MKASFDGYAQAGSVVAGARHVIVNRRSEVYCLFCNELTPGASFLNAWVSAATQRVLETWIREAMELVLASYSSERIQILLDKVRGLVQDRPLSLAV